LINLCLFIPIDSNLNDDEKCFLNSAKEIASNCKIIQTNLSNTPVEKKLLFKFKKEVDTRWLSKLYLLESVAKNIDMLVTLKNDEKLYHLFSAGVCTSINFINAHQKNLKDLVVILKAFEEPNKLFQVYLSVLFLYISNIFILGIRFFTNIRCFAGFYEIT